MTAPHGQISGWIVGSYEVVSRIGEGGMGVVYLARHRTLGRAAAIKVLRPELSTRPEIVSRLFNEARAATAIRSPGIVEVFDFGFLDDRSAYIVMEYLEGDSLAARIRRGRSSVAAALPILRGIARALEAAHDQGIVHRDLKPDNVFLVPDADLPSGERVKLLDFGIAKLVTEDGPASHTRTGTVLGTPAYMAPEQCRGSGAIDRRVDLYALGCVGYEMLCGQPPFVADGSADMMARHLYFAPDPPRSHRPGLPAAVEDLVLRLLHKDPAARPATALDVIRAIDRLAALPEVIGHHDDAVAGASTARPAPDTTLSGAASTSELDRTRPPAMRTVRANRRIVRIAAGLWAGALVLGGALIWFRPGHRGEPPPAHDASAAVPPAQPSSPRDEPASRPDLSSVTVTPILPEPSAPRPAPPAPSAPPPVRAAPDAAAHPARPTAKPVTRPTHAARPVEPAPPPAHAARPVEPAPALTREQLREKFLQVRREYDVYKSRYGAALEREWGELATFIQYMGPSADAADYAEAARRLDAFRARMQ